MRWISNHNDSTGSLYGDRQGEEFGILLVSSLTTPHESQPLYERKDFVFGIWAM